MLYIQVQHYFLNLFNPLQNDVELIIHINTLGCAVEKDFPVETYERVFLLVTIEKIIICPLAPLGTDRHHLPPHTRDADSKAMAGGVQDVRLLTRRNEAAPDEARPSAEESVGGPKEPNVEVFAAGDWGGERKAVILQQRLRLHADGHGGHKSVDDLDDVGAQPPLHCVPERGELAVPAGEDEGGHLGLVECWKIPCLYIN